MCALKYFRRTATLYVNYSAADLKVMFKTNTENLFKKIINFCSGNFVT